MIRSTPHPRYQTQRDLASGSNQFLRGKAHALLDEVFPVATDRKRRKRYAWLRKHFPKVHMSEVGAADLKWIIKNLEARKGGACCAMDHS